MTGSRRQGRRRGWVGLSRGNTERHHLQELAQEPLLLLNHLLLCQHLLLKQKQLLLIRQVPLVLFPFLRHSWVKDWIWARFLDLPQPVLEGVRGKCPPKKAFWNCS